MTATLPRPGQYTQLSSSPFPISQPAVTSGWFVTGLAEKGPLKATKIESLTQFIEKFGQRVSYGMLYDALDEYFSDGGNAAYVGRVVGPAAVSASHTLTDASAGESLKVTAIGPGEWANTFKIKVTRTGEEFVIEVFNGAVLLEVSPSFTTQLAAVNWAQYNPYITIALGASSLLPKTQEVTLENGKDDREHVVDESWRTAQELFLKGLGPGQISQAGRTGEQAHKDLLKHAMEFNRFALLDPPQSSVVSTVDGSALALRGTNDIYGVMCAPWITIPGVLPGTTRFVPPSAFVAAKIAESDAEGNSPNRPPANVRGKSKRAIGLEQPPFTGASGPEVTRDTMYSAGVNIIIEENGVVMLYGWRSLVDPNGANQDWLDAGNCRLRMAIVAEINRIAKKYVLDEIDGQGKTLKEFEGEIKSMLSKYWEQGSLFGKTAEEAYLVEVGANVNTPETIKNKEMKAAVTLRMSENSELVFTVVSKIPVTQLLP